MSVNDIHWKKVNHEEDGYPDDDSILYHAEHGLFYLRVNDMGDGYTWVLMHKHKVINESMNKRYVDVHEAILGAEIALKKEITA